MRFIDQTLSVLLLAVIVLVNGIDGISQHVRVLKPFRQLNPENAGGFYMPVAMVPDQAGNIYVVDQKNNRVVVFSRELRFLRQIGVVGQGPGELLTPTALAISRSGEVIVLDTGNQRVQRFDLLGRPLGSFRFKPLSLETLAVNSRDEIFLSEPMRTGKLVSVYSKNGQLLRTFGELRQPKEYSIEQEILTRYANEAEFAIDAEDNLIVAFGVLPALRKYDREGRLVFEAELRGPEVAKQLEELKRPDRMPRLVNRAYHRTMLVNGIAVDQKGRIWVQISGQHAIYVYNHEGKYITKFHTEIQGKRAGFTHIFIHEDLLFGTSATRGCWLLKLPAL